MASGPRFRRNGSTFSEVSTTSAPEAARSRNSLGVPSMIILSPALRRAVARSGPGRLPKRVRPRTVTAWRDKYVISEIRRPIFGSLGVIVAWACSSAPPSNWRSLMPILKRPESTIVSNS